MTVDLIKMMKEHTEIERDHTMFYELAEKHGFCTPWCHTNNSCDECEDREISLVV